MLKKLCPFLRKANVSKVSDENNLEINEKLPSYLEIMPLHRKLFYGCGGPPLQICSNAMGFFFAIFLLEVAKATPISLSVIQIISRVYDAISDPIVGYLVNKTDSRYGKFRPWMFYSTPVLCVAFFMLFSVPPNMSDQGKMAYYTVSGILLQTGLTTYHVPYSSMCMVLSSNPIDRDQLTSTRMAFEIVGVLIGAGIFGGIATRNRIISSANITEDEFTRERHDYMLASGVIVVICFFCSVVVILGSLEKDVINDNDEPYFKSVKKVLSFKPYIFVMMAFMFTSLGVQIIQGNLALYVTHTLNMPKHVTPGIMVLLVCALAQVPLGNFLIARFSKKTVYYIGTFNFFPVLLVILFLPPNIPVWVFYGMMVWVSFSIMVAMVLPWSMLPDVIDLFFLQNGFRLEAAFYSFYVFFNKFAVGFSLGASALAIQLSGYQTGQRVQPESVSTMLSYYISTSGIICFAISLVFLFFYPITPIMRMETTYKLETMKLTMQLAGDRKMSSLANKHNSLLNRLSKMSLPNAGVPLEPMATVAKPTAPPANRESKPTTDNADL